MYVLYQIGDVPLYDALLGANGDPVEAELSYGWQNDSTQFRSPGGLQYHSPLLRSVPEAVEFEIKGKLFQTPYLNASRTKARLRSMGGRRNVPVIVYGWEEGTQNCEPEIKWFVGYGMITEDSNDHAYKGTESGGSFLAQDLDLTIDLQQPFTQLSTWFWELRPMDQRLLDPYSDESAQSGINRFAHPTRFQDIPKYYYFIRWQESDTPYDPVFWGLNRLYEMSFGGQSSDFVDAPLDLFLYANEDIWAIEPRALYAFTNLSPLGTITIETELKSGLFHGETVVSESILDLVQLDSDLAAAGYGGLLTDDIIFCGAAQPRPGFIQRNDAALEGVRPRWTYDQAYPGEISKGATWIRFVPYLTDARVAYNIDFRTS